MFINKSIVKKVLAVLACAVLAVSAFAEGCFAEECFTEVRIGASAGYVFGYTDKPEGSVSEIYYQGAPYGALSAECNVYNGITAGIEFDYVTLKTNAFKLSGVDIMAKAGYSWNPVKNLYVRPALLIGTTCVLFDAYNATSKADPDFVFAYGAELCAAYRFTKHLEAQAGVNFIYNAVTRPVKLNCGAAVVF